MAEETELSTDPLLSPREVLDELEVIQLSGEGVAGKRFGLRERFAIGSDPTAREIEGYRGQPLLCERASEIRKERPVRESLEPVTNDDRSARGYCEIPGRQ